MRRIRIDRRLCKSCKICAELCPKGVINLNLSVIDSSRCTGCKLCVYYCPDFAVEVL